MKTSIFDMNFVLPPLAAMIEVEKDSPTHTGWMGQCSLVHVGGNCI